MGTRTSSKGTAALVFGILSMVFAVFFFFFPLGFLTPTTIRDCSRETTDAARQACVETRMNQE